VTRLGDFSPLGWLCIFGQFYEKYTISPILCLFPR
jgi:hypothetical protein